ncbi:MAG: CHAT domain-containing protein [Ilumatobacteraceae bacterium]
MEDPSISIDELLAMVDADPVRAVARATAGLGGGDASPRLRAELLWILGLAHRALGDLGAARRSLEQSRRLAADAGATSLAARVTISLAFEVAHGGDIAVALDLLDGVRDQASGADVARLANQRAILRYRLGQLDAAVADLEEARAVANHYGDTGTLLRVLVNLGGIQAHRGRFAEARQTLLDAIPLAFEVDQVAMAGDALTNLAFIATVEGDLPEALDCFASAEDGYKRSGTRSQLPQLYADHALALTDANLVGDAEPMIDRAIEMSRQSGNDLEVAELLLVSAEIDLALAKPDEAHEAAVDAGARFARQGRDQWWNVAERLRLRAESRLTPDDVAVAEGLAANGRALAAGGWRSEALAAILLAALLHARAGRDDRAAELLADVGVEAARGRAADRLLLGHVVALLAERRGDRAAARRAVTDALRVAAETQAALGSLETRSHAAQHGAELIELGARLAVADGRARELLHRIEAMRTMVWHAPLVRPPDDEAMAAGLTGLRRLNTVIADPETSVDDRSHAEQERLAVERSIRGLDRRARGERVLDRRHRTTTEQVVTEAVSDLRTLGDRQALAYADLDGRLLAVAVDRGRCRLHDLGSIEEVAANVDACGFTLHRLNRAQGSEASRKAARDSLLDATTALGVQLVPPAIARSDRPLVVVPTGVLHGVPWTALEVLRGRAVSVSPSLSGWSVAARSSVVRAGRRLLANRRPGEPAGFVAGPGLRFADAEVRRFAPSYRHSTVLTGGKATVDRCLRVLDRCELVHLACHGSFRRDNPLFSTLTMADGPLTIYDLERVEELPEVIVLSACSVASSASINGGTLLGLSSALGAFGASSVVAPLTPVSDEWVVPVMQRLHAGLAAGLSPAMALATAARSDGELDHTAAAFVAIGA